MLSQNTEEEDHEAASDDESDDSSQGTLEQEELTHPVSVSSQEKKCADMIFSCCDWERGREEPEILPDSADSKQCRRKDKAARKDQADEHVFDIDSIMNPHHTQSVQSLKRTKNDSQILLSQKIQKTDAAAQAATKMDSGVFCKPLTLLEVDTHCKKDECLSPMGQNEACCFDFSVK